MAGVSAITTQKGKDMTKHEEYELIHRIASRAYDILTGMDGINLRLPKFKIITDLDICHEHRPLDLAGLLDARPGDLLHDVTGIVAHLDQDTGQLRDCFVPRYALNQGGS